MHRRSILGSLAAGAFLLASAALAQQKSELRDPQGRLIGTISLRRDGVREARDRQYRLLGSYHPKSNTTRDRLGRLLTKGDSLSALLLFSRPPR